MTLRLDGAPASDEEISVHPDWAVEAESGDLLAYEIDVSIDQVVRSFRPYYEDYLSDSMTHLPDEDELVAQRLWELDWPSLDELLAEESRLFEQLALEVGYDLLHELFAGRKRCRRRYWICGLDEVRLASKVVKLRGFAMDWQLRA